MEHAKAPCDKPIYSLTIDIEGRDQPDEWMRTALMDANNEVYVPYVFAFDSLEDAADMTAPGDPYFIGDIDTGEVFLPTSWLAVIQPDDSEFYQAIADGVREALRQGLTPQPGERVH